MLMLCPFWLFAPMETHSLFRSPSPRVATGVIFCQTFGCLGNRKPGLLLESGRICEMDELVLCLPEKKWMSSICTQGPPCCLRPSCSLRPPRHLGSAQLNP